LNTIADKLAAIIYSGIGPLSNQENGDSSTPLVSLMMSRDVGVIAAILAILKCGAAYVPVDPTFPPDRQSYIFSQSSCSLLVTDQESFDQALSLGVSFPPLLVLETTTGAVLKNTIPRFNSDMESNHQGFNKETDRLAFKANDQVPKLDDQYDRLAYVLYTSGSTGKPKGVMVKQKGVVNVTTWFADQLKLSPSSRVLALTTLCFDISVLEVFMPLIRGATLVLAKSSTQKNPFRLLEYLEEAKVTVMQATPTTYEMMLATGWKGDASIDFLVGGEAFRPSLTPLSRNCKSLRNVYGPTETTIWSTSYTVPPIPSNSTTTLPIGFAISQVSSPALLNFNKIA